MAPLVAHGVKCMSMGFFTKGDAPVAWRGPMISQAVDKFFAGTDWGKLDVLVVDLPPGTGDVQISLSQRLPLTGAVIVSTPQEVALLDARRGLHMFGKVAVPVLGLVENMSSFRCPCCGHEEKLFGSGKVEAAAQELGLEVLGKFPLVPNISSTGDEGTPVVARDPDDPSSKAFAETARLLLNKIKARTEGGG